MYGSFWETYWRLTFFLISRWKSLFALSVCVCVCASNYDSIKWDSTISAYCFRFATAVVVGAVIVRFFFSSIRVVLSIFVTTAEMEWMAQMFLCDVYFA